MMYYNNLIFVVLLYFILKLILNLFLYDIIKKGDYMINIGFACKIEGDKKYQLKGIKLNNVTEEKIRNIVKHNLSALDLMIDYLIDNNIKLFRISSDIIPFASHKINNIKWWEEEKETLLKIGDKIKKNNIRVSMHPGQYTVLNSPKEEVVDNAINDLIYHKRFLDALKLDNSHKIVLHIGGKYDDKEKSIERFIVRATKLPNNILDRLIVENDDKNFDLDDVLYVSNELHIPVVLDIYHFKLNNKSNKTFFEYFEEVKKTWKEKDGRPKIHYSQALIPGKTSHSKTINLNDFVEDIKSFKDVDIMLEVKDKNISVLKTINFFKNNNY